MGLSAKQRRELPIHTADEGLVGDFDPPDVVPSEVRSLTEVEANGVVADLAERFYFRTHR